MSDDNDLRNRMTSEVDILAKRKRAKSWKPEVFDELFGELLRREKGKTKRGDKVDIAVFADIDSGEEVTCWLAPTVLRDKFEEANPQEGDTVLIRRLEDGVSEAGHVYKTYELTVEKASLPF